MEDGLVERCTGGVRLVLCGILIFGKALSADRLSSVRWGWRRLNAPGCFDSMRERLRWIRSIPSYAS